MKTTVKVHCAGCNTVINPGEGVEHRKWYYHRRCLSKHLSKLVGQLDEQMGKHSAEIAELRGDRPDDGSDAHGQIHCQTIAGKQKDLGNLSVCQCRINLPGISRIFNGF